MLYVLIGFLKDDADPVPQSVQVQTSDFIGQPFTKVQSAGVLRDASGKRAGMMLMFEDESREAAEVFVKASPYIQAHLFKDYILYEYIDEVG